MSRTHRRRSLLRTAGEAGPAPPHPTTSDTAPSDPDGSAPRPAGRRANAGPNPGQPVRWKRPGGSHWLYGHLGDDPVEAGGGLRVYEDRTGGARTLRPDQLQMLVRGPRGGQRWLPYAALTAVTPSLAERLQQTAARSARPEPRGMTL